MHTELRNHGLSALLAIASLTGTVWAQPAQFQVNGIPDFSQYQKRFGAAFPWQVDVRDGVQ